MTQIWNTSGQKIHPKILSYTVKEDYKIDQEIFLPYDLRASQAHGEMLNHIGLLSKKELLQIKKGLAEIKELWKSGKFIISPEQEDCHTAIETYLTEKYGVAGEKIHTARSRNDQSLTMIRLYEKDQLSLILKLIDKLNVSWGKFAKKHKDTEMPGYTHMQKAMPTTVGMWIDTFKSALSDAKILIKTVFTIIDQSPLGSGAGFGIPLKINRKFTAKKMGFSRVQKNPIYCQFSRGMFEEMAMHSLLQVMTILGRYANDLLMFTMSEFNYFALPSEFCTSSSIMPQKKNYDVLEIMRGNVAIVSGALHEIRNISEKLHAGYHRDLQLIKMPLVRGFDIVIESLEIAEMIGAALQVNKDNLQKAMTEELYATQKVYEKVKKGMPFRKAYGDIKKSLN